MAAVHEQVVLFWLSPFPTDGKEAYQQTLRAFFDNLESASVTPINPQVRVIDSTGLAWGHAQFAVKPKGGLVATSYAPLSLQLHPRGGTMAGDLSPRLATPAKLTFALSDGSAAALLAFFSQGPAGALLVTAPLGVRTW